MGALPVVLKQDVTHCLVPTDGIRRCGHVQVGHGAAHFAAVVCLDTESDQDIAHSDSDHSIFADDSSDSDCSIDSFDMSWGGSSADFEGSDDNSDSVGAPAVSRTLPLLRHKGLSVDIHIASAATMRALSSLGHPERMRAYGDPTSERVTLQNRVSASMDVIASHVRSGEVLVAKSRTQYDNLLPSQAPKQRLSLPSPHPQVPFPAPHPHIRISRDARRVAVRKKHEAQLPGGHPHQRYQGTTPYATYQQSQDCAQHLVGLCDAFQVALLVVEADVTASVLATKVRDDHFNAPDYLANWTEDMLVETRHANQRDILVRWVQSFCRACELSTIYLQQSLQTPDFELETVLGYFGPLGKWRDAHESRSMYYQPGSDPRVSQTVVQALAAVSEVNLLVGLRVAINHAMGGLFQGDSLPHIDSILNAKGLLLIVIGSYNTSTDLPITEELACGGRFVTGGYSEGSIGTFEAGMYAGPMECMMPRMRRAMFDIMPFQKKLVWNETPTRRYPNGSYIQTNSVHQLDCMPPNGLMCMHKFIGVAAEALTAVRSLPDQSNLTQTWVSSGVPNCGALYHSFYSKRGSF